MKQHLKHISEALGLMNSMIACGESHSPSSHQTVQRAYDAITALNDAVTGTTLTETVVQAVNQTLAQLELDLNLNMQERIAKRVRFVIQTGVLPPTSPSYSEHPLEHMEVLGARNAYYVRDPMGDYHYARPQPMLLKPEYRNLSVES